MNWAEIDPALRRLAAERAGYTTYYSGVDCGWGARWAEFREEGRFVRIEA